MVSPAWRQVGGPESQLRGARRCGICSGDGGGIAARVRPHAEREHPANAVDRSLAIVLRNLFRERARCWRSVASRSYAPWSRRQAGGVRGLDPHRRERIAARILHGRGPSQLYRLKREFDRLRRYATRTWSRSTSCLWRAKIPIFADGARRRRRLRHTRDGSGPRRCAGARSATARGAAQLAMACARCMPPASSIATSSRRTCWSTRSGRVVLLDFGLVRDPRAEDRPAGSRGYARVHGAGAGARASRVRGERLVQLRDGAARRARRRGSPQGRRSRSWRRASSTAIPRARPGWGEIAATIGGGPQDTRRPPARARRARGLRRTSGGAAQARRRTRVQP